MKINRLHLAGAAIAVMLCACDARQDGATPGQKLDRAIASAEVSASDARKSAQQGLQETKIAAHQLAQVSREKASEVARSVTDATITAGIKSDLAKDPELSALHITVDTHAGRVSLYGSAPSDQAKRRAEHIASAQTGVVAVDDKLGVQAQ